MSNSNYYGHIDRRRRVPLETCRVKAVYDAVDEECSVPKSEFDYSALKMVAQRKASRALGMTDRSDIEDMADALAKKTNVGFDSALTVLAHIGILLNAADGAQDRV